MLERLSTLSLDELAHIDIDTRENNKLREVLEKQTASAKVSLTADQIFNLFNNFGDKNHRLEDLSPTIDIKLGDEIIYSFDFIGNVDPLIELYRIIRSKLDEKIQEVLKLSKQLINGQVKETKNKKVVSKPKGLSLVIFYGNCLTGSNEVHSIKDSTLLLVQSQAGQFLKIYQSPFKQGKAHSGRNPNRTLRLSDFQDGEPQEASYSFFKNGHANDEHAISLEKSAIRIGKIRNNHIGRVLHLNKSGYTSMESNVKKQDDGSFSGTGDVIAIQKNFIGKGYAKKGTGTRRLSCFIEGDYLLFKGASRGPNIYGKGLLYDPQFMLIKIGNIVDYKNSGCHLKGNGVLITAQGEKVKRYWDPTQPDQNAILTSPNSKYRYSGPVTINYDGASHALKDGEGEMLDDKGNVIIKGTWSKNSIQQAKATNLKIQFNGQNAIFTGQIIDDELEGDDLQLISEGNFEYRGSMKNSQFNGHGVFETKRYRIEGEFKDGKAVENRSKIRKKPMK